MATDPMITAVVTVTVYNPLLPHFLRHYRRLGVDRMVVCVTPDCEREVARDAASCPVAVLHPVAEPQAADECFDVWKDRNENLALRRHATEFKMPLDLDEFHEYPGDLRSVTDRMRSTGTAAIGGRLIDRFGVNFTTPPVTDEDVFVTFPVQDPAFSSSCGACPDKVMLCRTECRLTGGRHKLLDHDCRFDHKVHHFKWTAGNISNLERRLHDGSPFDNRNGKRDPRSWTQYCDEVDRELKLLRLRQVYGLAAKCVPVSRPD